MQIIQIKRRLFMALAAFAWVAFSAPMANAVLGGSADSVAADQARMKASRTISANPRYQIHELQAGEGNLVREYVSPEGKVFGVAWKSHFLPQLPQLLGSYADRLTAAARTRTNHRAPLQINQPDFVYSAFGHQGFYAGHAYIPAMLPAGVSAEEIK